ncbi:hypothetical protein PR202_gb02338 [Eleusine coracana subsp. coracana]|uniref:C2H2-type domain-containing protein n=1 Tax=Eleusine coracana subsp. coracana TaxID=191504 RepID=A0AAV5DXZ8_ELECO|nr:hypothetical protein PR202_gb02338 [Eleusine coracana subsp. coracana]
MMGSSMIPAGGGGGNPPPYFLHHQQQEQLFHGGGGGGGALDGDGICFMEQPAASSESSDALLYNLSVLKEKVQQLQPLVAFAVAGPVAAASSGATAVIQEIISAASSMMYAFQQLCNTTHQSSSVVVAGGHHFSNKNNNNQQQPAIHHDCIMTTTTTAAAARRPGQPGPASSKRGAGAGGGASSGTLTILRRSYYSCPQEGCRWNRKHAKFQPLKSVICAKNHYKRSHCPKMYVCNRCNLKHFSVLSDLRTHEKHCGDHRWLCSCGTSFSRKDKLIGHLALFAGHHPAVPLDNRHGNKRSSSSTTTSLPQQHHGGT